MFKSKGKKNFRQRKRSESDEEPETVAESGDGLSDAHLASIEEAKQMQKLRKRQNGISAEELAAVQVKKKSEKKTKDDPFKIKTGGFVDMKTLKTAEVDDEVMEQIGTAFASETNRRDEDAEMVKYVEAQMAKRKGTVDSEEGKANTSADPTASLYEMPEHIKAMTGSRIKKSEDMLSNQMLSGIPEVDLGIMAKIKNIEATEEAKQKLIQESMKKKEDKISLVPTNYAVNFSQHNRFNIEETKPVVPKKVVEAPAPVRVGDAEKAENSRSQKRTKNTEKATDDFVYDKFKKHMRRF